MAKKVDKKALLNLQVQHEQPSSNSSNLASPILAVDYGQKFCGLAISLDGQTVLPLAVVEAAELSVCLARELQNYSVKMVVFGLPVSSDGRENHICAAIRKQVKYFESLYPTILFALVNERFSSQNALLSKASERFDDLAAMQILEFYLAQKRR